MKPGNGALLALASETAAQNVVEFNLHRGIPDLKLGSMPPLSRRATYTQELANNITGGGYYAEVSIGEPPQIVTMVLDTGSSDAWVVSYKADLCTSARLQQQYGDSCGGTYDPRRSSTYSLVDRDGFYIQYLDGGVASGDYISDSFSIGGITIESLQIGYATQTVRGTGILGVGFSANEAALVQYPNIIDELTAEGLISVKAYSLYLNDRRSSSGTILFGGIDTEKFIGPLKIMPIIKALTANYTSFEVAFTGMGVTYTNGSTVAVATGTRGTLPAILDSGTTLSYLPDAMASKIIRELGAITDKVQTGLTFIDCEFLNTERDLTITFDFNNTAITVPVWEMVLDILGDYQSILPSTIPYERACLFGIQSTAGFEDSGAVKNSNFALLGDTFLRSAYVVYDLEHYQIGMAQANVNSTGTSVVELKAGDSGLPSLTGVSEKPVSPTPTSGGDGGGSIITGGGVATVTVTEKSSAPATVRMSGGGDMLALLAVTTMFALVGSTLVAL